MTVLNPGDLDVSVTLTAYKDDGALIEQNSFNVGAKQKMGDFVEDLLPLTANNTGWLCVESAGGVWEAFWSMATSRSRPTESARWSACPNPQASTFRTSAATRSGGRAWSW